MSGTSTNTISGHSTMLLFGGQGDEGRMTDFLHGPLFSSNLS